MTELGAVRVPASSANLGPGFDAFAVAVDVHLTVTAVQRQAQRVTASGAGATELPGDDSNLIWRAVVAYCQHGDVAVPQVSLVADNAIPLERGMGSSAAAAVAGVVLGRALTAAGGTDDDLIALAAELEGHPDNAAAAVLGGLVVCYDGVTRRLEPTEQLRPILCVPDSRQSTDLARGLLPATITHAAAAANGARAAAVLAGLAGAVAFDPRAMVDVLHEPPRFEAMKSSGALVRRLRAQQLGACLSGAGPSVLVILAQTDAQGDSDEDADATGLERIRELAGAGWTVRAQYWDRAGATVSRRPPGA